MSKTRAQFRMPAEWEPHRATWIAWPHHEPYWPGKFGPIPWVYTEIARAIAERLVQIEPCAAEDPQASIAPFVDPRVAKRLSDSIDAGLFEPGAEEITAQLRKGPRLVSAHGSTFLLPTVIHCTSPSHPLANREFLFPFVSVVDLSADEMATAPEPLGPTLVVSALTRDQALIDRLLGSDLIGRLNLGPIQTNAIVWDQPHEGNLFEHLYARRAFQRAG